MSPLGECQARPRSGKPATTQLRLRSGVGQARRLQVVGGFFVCPRRSRSECADELEKRADATRGQVQARKIDLFEALGEVATEEMGVRQGVAKLRPGPSAKARPCGQLECVRERCEESLVHPGIEHDPPDRDFEVSSVHVVADLGGLAPQRLEEIESTSRVRPAHKVGEDHPSLSEHTKVSGRHRLLQEGLGDFQRLAQLAARVEANRSIAEDHDAVCRRQPLWIHGRERLRRVRGVDSRPTGRPRQQVEDAD